MKKNNSTFKIGDTLYFQNDYNGSFLAGTVLRITPQFCIMENSRDGYTQRKAKHLLYDSMDAAKITVMKKIDSVIQEQFKLSMHELHQIYSEMTEKFPEKFV